MNKLCLKGCFIFIQFIPNENVLFYSRIVFVQFIKLQSQFPWIAVNESCSTAFVFRLESCWNRKALETTVCPTNVKNNTKTRVPIYDNILNLLQWNFFLLLKCRNTYIKFKEKYYFKYWVSSSYLPISFNFVCIQQWSTILRLHKYVYSFCTTSKLLYVLKCIFLDWWMFCGFRSFMHNLNHLMSGSVTSKCGLVFINGSKNKIEQTPCCNILLNIF